MNRLHGTTALLTACLALGGCGHYDNTVVAAGHTIAPAQTVAPSPTPATAPLAAKQASAAELRARAADTALAKALFGLVAASRRMNSNASFRATLQGMSASVGSARSRYAAERAAVGGSAPNCGVVWSHVALVRRAAADIGRGDSTLRSVIARVELDGKAVDTARVTVAARLQALQNALHAANRPPSAAAANQVKAGLARELRDQAEIQAAISDVRGRAAGFTATAVKIAGRAMALAAKRC